MNERTGPAFTKAHSEEIISLCKKDPPHRYPPILGLVGPLGCGKTSTADAVVLLVHGRRISCAGPIRDMLAALGVEREAMTKRKNEPIPWLHGCTSRSLMKSLGTEWGREYVGEDIWINSVLREAAKSDQPIVIDDIRFDNEARAVKAAGGHLLYVLRPGCSYTWEHLSECALSNWDPVDGVIGLATGTVITSTLRRTLFPSRPWWANWAVGRRFARIWHSMFPPPVPSSRLAPPSEVAYDVVCAWNDLTQNRATAFAGRH